MAGGSGLTRDTVSLTHRSIESLRPAEAPYRISDQRCIGLAVRVAPSGTKTWDLAYRVHGSGKVRRVSLGRTTDVSLEKARERANELTSAARTGRDLIAEEEESRAVAASRLTVEGLIELYVRRRVAGRLRTAKEIERRLMRALSPILYRYAADIRRRDIRELLDAVADGGIEREAEKRRQTVGAMFRWAISQDIVETDPTSGLKAYDPGTPRDRVLTAAEIEALWKWLDSGDLPPDPADILKLELLTGARCGEISGLCVEEIDRDEWTWTLPTARSKNKRPRVTPLVGLARQIVADRLLQTQKGPLFKAEIGTVLTSARVGHFLLTRRDRLPIDKFNTHDLRRTVATMLAEMGQPLDLVATVIGDEVGGKNTRTLVRHYVRTDLIERKLHMLRLWDERLQDIIAGRAASNVLHLQWTA
jgi:integrase